MFEAVKRLVASRKALIAVVGAAFAVAVHFVPELAPLKGDALALVEAGLALLATLIAAEDIGASLAHTSNVTMYEEVGKADAADAG